MSGRGSAGWRLALTAAWLLLALLLPLPVARAESWPVFGLYGFWGYLGLGEEVEYDRNESGA
ncbi:MAG: hypothetical protein ACM3UP_01165, partial [Methanocella sp.]